MGTGASMVRGGGGGGGIGGGRNILKNNNFISECPEKIGGNAFGLEDALLPLECQ